MKGFQHITRFHSHLWPLRTIHTVWWSEPFLLTTLLVVLLASKPVCWFASQTQTLTWDTAIIVNSNSRRVSQNDKIWIDIFVFWTFHVQQNWEMWIPQIKFNLQYICFPRVYRWGRYHGSMAGRSWKIYQNSFWRSSSFLLWSCYDKKNYTDSSTLLWSIQSSK